MRVIYFFGIKIYGLLIWILSPFNDKAKKWVHGRKGLLAQVAEEADGHKGCVWFHFASLGEFEQGRPVLEAIKIHWPDKPVVVTFYSPSGYEIRKDTPLAANVFYLPEDTPRNAAAFIRLINPEIAIFTKYEYWHFYFRTLAANKVPLFLISTIFRPDQVFFKWYGGFFRQTLGYVTHFFTQNEESCVLLNSLGFTNVELAGDTRFDRVIMLPETRNPIPEIEAFADGNPVLVAGSTWPQDEHLLADLHNRFPSWKIIIAPHEIHEDHLSTIEKLFPQAIRFSNNSQSTTGSPSLTTGSPPPANVLIIDSIGMLSSLYAYGSIAYIGGGFGAGIHNTLEAATYGIPVIFGPKYHKFQEAKDLVAKGAGFSVEDATELATIFGQMTSRQNREQAGNIARQYVLAHAGATDRILNYLKERW
ncbi:3-deoxy-D-manno-octulosonic acid transferase [Parapedobacter sp. ISTM3]|nr:glycosyltransferase N-terminal domain-containing protein [Parapedobacter sp. ISTM3]MBK1441239.1 3-deoxy-D-manno-octulosonic acid transferase [Parapedobacter sp. ISTM3]